MTNYASGKPEEKTNEEPTEGEVDIRTQKVVTQETIVEKPGVGKRLKEMFIKTSAKDVKGYVVHQVVIPGIKDLLHRTLNNTVDMFFAGRGSTPPNQPNQTHVTYNASPVRQPMTSTMLPSQPVRFTGQHMQHSVTIATYEDAEAVLSTMYEALSRYGVVSLATFYNMTGQPVQPIDHKWGWTQLTGSAIRQVQNGFVLDLPAVIPVEEPK